jgi:hypothetical protein
MMAIKTWFGYGWAQPVVKRRWALWATVTQWVKQLSGYRLAVVAHHNAWERACGLR